VVKGVVLAGGKGTRLRPLTFTGAKQLVPIANKPVIFYAIEDLVEAGITDIGVVVPADSQMARQQIMTALGDGAAFGATITYIDQDAPKGLAHAVSICREFVGDEKFVVYLGDNFIREGIVPQVQAFRSGTMNALLLLYRVPEPQGLGIAVVEDGRVVELQEKPQVPKSDLAIIGIYLLDRHFFEVAEGLTPSARGELEITDALARLITLGYTVQPEIVTGWWIDTGKHHDMLTANRLVLETIETCVAGHVDAQSQVDGRVTIEPGVEIVHSIVRGPAIIGRGTRIVDSFIGPFTSVGPCCLIEHSEVEHSIVMEGSTISHLPWRVEGSLIGRNVELSRSTLKPRAHKLLLGDYSQVRLAD
jgi:glucose-1-phosphate thymidylyltransferase